MPYQSGPFCTKDEQEQCVQDRPKIGPAGSPPPPLPVPVIDAVQNAFQEALHLKIWQLKCDDLSNRNLILRVDLQIVKEQTFRV